MGHTKRNVDRREFLNKSALAAFGLSIGLPDLKKFTHGTSKAVAALSLPRVRVSADRVIRTVVGLRPYRPSGFVLNSEKIDNKIIVHNYGHGGGGVSLSWGTATLAVEKVLTMPEREIAVIGCGVIGLSTARLLQRKGYQVTIYSRELPPETTSNIAGALWDPVSVYDVNFINNDFLSVFNLASKISHRIFQDYVGVKYGVWWIKNYFLGYPFDFPGGRELYPGFTEHRNPRTYFGYEVVHEINTMMIEPPIYLPALMQDFFQAGGKMKIRSFETLKDVIHLPEKIIMNCTGLGSKKLFNDYQLVPVKGQLSVLLPQPEIDYGYVAPAPGNLLYMFPRKDGIILGGTSENDNWSLEPKQEESDRILRGHLKLAETLKE